MCGEADADDNCLDDGNAEDVSGGCALHVWNAGGLRWLANGMIG